jgi:hypothetical protein
MPELKTAAEIRAKYPNPIRYSEHERYFDETHARSGPPPCYCVAGALCLADGEDWCTEFDEEIDDEEDRHVGAPDVEVLFPIAFHNNLTRRNPLLSGNLPSFQQGNSDICGVYASAIQGANDETYLQDLDRQPIEIKDHFELAWRLLDDALTFNPATWSDARELRLLAGSLMYICADNDYWKPERPGLIAYRTRHWDRYQELCKTAGIADYQPPLG